MIDIYSKAIDLGAVRRPRIGVLIARSYLATAVHVLGDELQLCG